MSFTTAPFSHNAVPSAQAVFDEVVEHLMRQGAPARKSTYGACLYRSKERKCAVGFLISDEVYTPKMEERGICDLLDNFGKELPSYFFTHKDLLLDLQTAHDSWSSESSSKLTFREHILAECIAIALRHNLEWMEVKFHYGKYKKAPIVGPDLNHVPEMIGEPS